MLLLISDVILGIVATILLIFASLEDFKKKEVYDIISYVGIAIAILVRLTYSLITNDWHYFAYAFIVFCLALVFGFFMYFTNQWGGGDTNILMALAWLLGTWPVYLFNSFAKEIFNNIPNGLLLSLTFFGILLFASVFSGVFVGLGYGLWVVFHDYARFKREIKQLLEKYNWLNILIFIIFLLTIIEGFYFRFLTFFYLGLLIVITYCFAMFSAAVERLMIKEVTPNELTEGDWVLDDVVVNGKVIYKHTQPGIELKQIELLKKLWKEKKFRKKLKVKEGFPFVPAFLFGWLIVFCLFFF